MFKIFVGLVRFLNICHRIIFFSQDFSGEFVKPEPEEGSESPLKFSRLTSMDEGIDDGFLDVLEGDTARLSSVTNSMTSLFNAPVLAKSASQGDDDDTPVVSYGSRRNKVRI